MAKKSHYTPKIRTREEQPKLRETKEGVQIICPFCETPHPLLPNIPTPCGTALRITAVQQIISSRTVRDQGLTCLRCGKDSGEMVQYMNGFIHLENCAPDVRLLREIPTYSKLAKIVYNLPEKFRDLAEKMTGKTQKVTEINAAGEQTGATLGYFFLKGS